MDLLGAIKDTPLPTILVLAGIGFWLLAVAGSVAGKITVQSAGRWFAGLVGQCQITAHRGNMDDCSVRAFALKPLAFGAPLGGVGA